MYNEQMIIDQVNLESVYATQSKIYIVPIGAF